MMQLKLSAVVITFNEERNIERCIVSLQKVADEILVVDSFSTDRTEAICRSHGVRFMTHQFDGHIQQKNYAKAQAKYKHVLSLDADEALDHALVQSVLQAKKEWKYEAWSMNRLTNYCGKWIHHSGWYPDQKIRLFNRDFGAWGGSNPHDRFIPNKGIKIGFLKGDILHYSYYNKTQHIKQIEYFSGIAANALYEKGKSFSWFKILFKPVARFVKAYLIRFGFLDGMAGFTIARLSAYANYLKYVKLKKLQKGEKI